jgi:delta 1-pyrroline-5-carboxylate dehydrogenase
MIAKNGLNGKTYSLGSGVGMRIEEFIKRILEISTSNVKISRNTTLFQVDDISCLVTDMI